MIYKIMMDNLVDSLVNKADVDFFGRNIDVNDTNFRYYMAFRGQAFFLFFGSLSLFCLSDSE
jgi:hypothetical protein